MVIQIIQKLHVITDKPASQTPVCLHGHGKKTGTVASEAVKSSGWAGMVLRTRTNVQSGQRLTRARGMNGLNACHAPRFELRLKPFVPGFGKLTLLRLDLQRVHVVSCRFELNHICAGRQFVKVISPLLHHRCALLHVLSAVVRPDVRILHGVG